MPADAMTAGRRPFLFVRHGQTEYNVRGILAGSTDVALTETGMREAAAAAEILAGEPLRAVCSSPLKRARDTARLIAAPHRLPVTVIEDLRERDWGEWEGQMFPADLGHPQPPGGEAMAAYLARVERALAAFFALTGDGPAAMVAHGGIFHALSRLLAVAGGDAGVIGNAVPVRFRPPATAGGWTAAPLTAMPAASPGPAAGRSG